MSELPCPYCGFNCEIPSNIEEKIECPNCGSICLYIQKSESHGTIDYRPSPKINDRGRQMSELEADNTFVFGEECLAYKKSEADKVIADLEESHKKEVEQLLMKIAGLEKLVETADKLVKQKGGFTVKDITFNGVKLEGVKNEP